MMRRGLEFRILGPLEVRVNGVPARVGGPRQRALLGLLLLSANAVVSRDRLIDELLGDQSSNRAEHALRVRVSRLRKVLGQTRGSETRLVARPPGYVLRVESGELDLHAFERRLAEGRTALENNHPDRAAVLLREAESLWRGRPLADLEFEPSARVEVARLEEWRLAAVEARIEAELELGRHSGLAPELEALVAVHPFRERLRAQLMLALYRSGRQADALESYRAGRSLLVEELALEPGRQLRELEQAILRHDVTLELPEQRPGPVGGPASELGAGTKSACVLLERDRQRSLLSESLACVERSSHGRLVFVSGEAGGGKTVLVRRFCEDSREVARILWAGCDALFTPRPLGPLLDIAELTGGELKRMAAGAARPNDILRTLLAELGKQAPTILVVEDLHWADEATLDVLRLLARRVDAVPVLLIATYRDDELNPAHPLRIVLGELAADAAITRLRVEPLSAEAVAVLAEPARVNADELYRRTGGNPFFVSEALAVGEGEIPPTVRDAVLARVSRLSARARILLDAVAIVPQQTELWLLATIVGDAVDRIEECTSSGILRPDRHAVSFRHELARLAVEESLAPDRALRLHQKALAALASPPMGSADLARLAHHAEAAADADAVLKFAPAAAAQASLLGAHSAAAAQYARALRFAEAADPRRRAELFERRAYECNLTDQRAEAVAAAKQALDYHRLLGERRKEGDSLRLLSIVLLGSSGIAEVERAAEEAVSVLEGLRPGRELALAYANLAQVLLNIGDPASVRTWGRRAVDLGERLGDTEVLVSALVSMGAAELLEGKREGEEKVERAITLARGGLKAHVAAERTGRAHACLAWAAMRNRSYALADRHVHAGLEHCAERDLHLWRHYLIAYEARSHLDQGLWAKAADSAEAVLHTHGPEQLARTCALIVLGLVRARRGDRDAWPPLREAHTLAQASGMLQALAPAQAALSEATWLSRNGREATDASEIVLPLDPRQHDPWLVGELYYWRWRAGAREAIPAGIAEPYALQIAGEPARAAELWRVIGCPYEAALALADTDDNDALRGALDELQRLGARPAAAIIARRLRDRGARPAVGRDRDHA